MDTELKDVSEALSANTRQQCCIKEQGKRPHRRVFRREPEPSMLEYQGIFFFFFSWQKSLVLKCTAFHNLTVKLTIKEKLNCLFIEKIYGFMNRGHMNKLFAK